MFWYQNFAKINFTNSNICPFAGGEYKNCTCRNNWQCGTYTQHALFSIICQYALFIQLCFDVYHNNMTHNFDSIFLTSITMIGVNQAINYLIWENFCLQPLIGTCVNSTPLNNRQISITDAISCIIYELMQTATDQFQNFRWGFEHACDNKTKSLLNTHSV